MLIYVVIVKLLTSSWKLTVPLAVVYFVLVTCEPQSERQLKQFIIFIGYAVESSFVLTCSENIFLSSGTSREHFI